MTEEYDPAFPTDEDVGNVQDFDDGIAFGKKILKTSSKEMEGTSQHPRRKNSMETVLSDATVDSSSASLPGTPSSPPPPPPPPKQVLEQSTRTDAIIPPPPPPQQQMDLFSGLPPPKLVKDIDLPPPPPPPPNKNGKYKVGLIDQPPPPPPPLPRRFDPYKNLPQASSDELLLLPPPPPPPGEKPKHLPKTKVSYSPPPTAASCQVADSSFDSTNLAFLSLPPPPPPPPPRPTVKETAEEWAKSICTLLVPPPPPPPVKEEANITNISSSMTSHANSNIKDQSKKTGQQTLGHLESNNLSMAKECPEPLTSTKSVADSNTCPKSAFASHVVEQELVKTGAVWKDTVVGRTDQVMNKKSRASKWDIKPQFLQRIEEKQKKAAAKNLLPKINIPENVSLSESLEEKMFLELEKELVTKKLKAENSHPSESHKNRALSDKHKQKDHHPENKLLEDAKKKQEESKSKEVEVKSNVLENFGSDVKKQNELVSPTKLKKKKKGLEFKPFVIKPQKTTERFATRGRYQLKSALSELDDRDSVVESSYLPPKHMTGKIPSVKLKAKQKADLLDTVKKDAEKELKTPVENVNKFEIKLESNSLSKLDLKPIVKTPMKFEPNVDVKDLKGFQIKPETSPSMWMGFKDKTNVVNKIELPKMIVKTEAVEKSELTLGKESSDESFYAKLIKKSEMDVKHKNIIGFESSSSENKLNLVNKIQHQIDSKRDIKNKFIASNDDKISNIKIEPSHTGIKPVNTGDKQIDSGNKLVDTVIKPVDTAIKLVDTGDKQIDSGNKLVDTAIKPVDTAFQPVDTGDIQIDSGNIPVDTAIKPIDTAIKPVDTGDKRIDSGNKPVDTAIKLVDTAIKPVDTAIKPVNTAIKPVDIGIDSNKFMTLSDNVVPIESVCKAAPEKIKTDYTGGFNVFPVVEEKCPPVSDFEQGMYQNEATEELVEFVIDKKIENLISPLSPVMIDKEASVDEFIDNNSENVEYKGHKAIPQEIEFVSSTAGHHVLSSERTKILETIPLPEPLNQDTDIATETTSLKDVQMETLNPVSIPNQQELKNTFVEVQVDKESSIHTSCTSVSAPVSSSAHGVEKCMYSDAGYHPSEVSDLKHPESNSKYLNSDTDVSGNLQNISNNSEPGIGKQFPDLNNFGSISEGLASLPEVDTLSDQKALTDSENISSEITHKSVYDQTLSQSHSNLPGDDNDKSNAVGIISQDSINSDNDDSNQELSSGTNHTSSDITDTENGDLTFKKKGKRKRWHVDSESTHDEAEESSRGRRRRSNRIKSLEVKKRESPKTVMEQSNKLKNDSKHGSKEHSPVHEITENIQKVEADNSIVFTQEDLQQMQEITTTPQVSDIPSKQIEPQTGIMETGQSQSSNSDSQCPPGPEFDRADKTHGVQETVQRILLDESNSSIFTETKVIVDNLDVKNCVELEANHIEHIEDLFENEKGEDKEKLLGPGLATNEAEEDSVSRQSGGSSSSNERSEKKHRVIETPDYQAMGILNEHEIPAFDSVVENIYLTERKRSKASKEARRMLCECSTSSEDRRRGIKACDEDCLNKLLMIECTSRCPCGDYCTNKRFQRHEYAEVGVFYNTEKGHGLKALTNIREGTFVMEYCGEVLNFHEFQQRVKQYNKVKQHHFYFMALKTDEIIDATKRGNTSRFINHSCNPNCETQKWTVNGALRVGFFTTKPLKVGEELTFDYQFEVYGEEAQKCYCGADNCRGFIGKRKAQPKGRETSTPRRRSTQERRKKESFEDISLDEEIEAMCSDMQNDGLQKPDNALRLSRFMVRAETSSQRLKLLQVLQDTKKQECLKYFLTHHGLALIWSWMVDLGENREELQVQILATLDILPIPHKNMLEDSKVMSVVNKWAKEAALISKSSEPEVEYSSASETPSRAATPSITANQNTPNNVTAMEEADLNTPVKQKPDIIYVGITTPKSSKDSGEPPKKKLLRQLQSEGVLPNPQLIVESLGKNKNETDENKVSESGNKAESLKQGDENSEEICEVSLVVNVKDGSETESIKDKTENRCAENSTKEGGVLSAESETKLSIAKAAASLLESWSSLKEIYIIPKLDKDKERDRDRKDRDRHRDKDRNDRDRDRNRDRDQDRYRERSRERERSRYDRDNDRYRDRDRRDRRRDYVSSKKRSRSRSRERDDRKETEGKMLPKLRKPWKDQHADEPDRKRAKELSKQERRQAFEREMEEQILKKEEEKKLKEEMMQQQMMDNYYEDELQYSHFVDSNGYPIPHYALDPNCPEMPYQMPFPEHGEPGMLPPPGMVVPQEGMMPVDGNDPNAMIYHHVDENGVPVQMAMQYGDPAMHHRQGLLPTPPPGQGMMPPDQMPLGWDPNHGPPIFPHQPPAIQDHMLPPPGIQDHMLPPPGIQEHMVPPGIPDHIPPGIQDHMVADHIQPTAHWESNPNLPSGPGMQSQAAGGGGGGAGYVMRQQTPVLTQQAPSQAQTTTFITPDGMLITQTITPLADPNVHQQLQSQLINQNLTPVAVNSQTSSTSISSIQTVVPTVEDIPSPPKPPPNKLPPNWKTATDSEGKVYYYHAITRQTQWDPPSWEGNDAIQGDDEVEMDLGTPTYDERKHRRTTTAAADTSSETAKKCKDHFRSRMSGYVVTVLNTYRKPDCKIGRITNTEDFKHLARKLTHGIMAKELKHCKNMEDLEVNSNVKHKAKEYIRKYMGRYGSLYRKEPD